MHLVTIGVAVQLELHAHEQLDKAWRRLAKREAKALQAKPAHTPAAKQPEAVFLPEMLDEFLQVRLVLHSDLHSRRNVHRWLVYKCLIKFGHKTCAMLVTLLTGAWLLHPHSLLPAKVGLIMQPDSLNAPSILSSSMVPLPVYLELNKLCHLKVCSSIPRWTGSACGANSALPAGAG